MALEHFALTEKVAIVTGGGRGIGKSIALGFADAGADVAIVTVSDIIPTSAEKTAIEIGTMGRRALPLVADMRHSDQVAEMVDRVMKEFGHIDILVNNVGGSLGLFGRFLEAPEKNWNAVIEANLQTCYYCCKEVGRVMTVQRKGSIINISSFCGLGPWIALPAYGVAKAAIINLTQTLAADWARFHVRVNAIAPGYTLTPQLEKDYQERPEHRERDLRRIPLGRFATGEDIANAAIYFASDASNYVTGETLVVAGGFVRF